MGVDAEILIKITKPESWLNPAQLRQLSARLTSIIGVENFMLEPEENRHAITFVKDDNARWPEEWKEIYGTPYDPNAPAIYSQDGDDIVAEPNEQFLRIHLFLRYYAEEYARGDWKTISFILMWCVYNIPDAEVWYGGDSSGCCAELMTDERMQEMTRYYLTSGHDEYIRKAIFKCEFCTTGVTSSGGLEVGFWSCMACGAEWVTTSTAPGSFMRPATPELITKYDPRGEDNDIRGNDSFFKISDQVRSGNRKMYPFDGVFRSKYPVVSKNKKALKAATPMLESGE